MALNEMLMRWLREFEDAISYKTPRSLYHDLVQMGVAKPGTTNQGCDCIIAIQELEKNIQRCEDDLRDNWSMSKLIDNTKGRIKKAKEEIEEYKDVHATHGEYNREVHHILMTYGIQRVRRACIADLHGPTTTCEDGSVYCRIARKEYGELLSTFLVANPEGWF